MEAFEPIRDEASGSISGLPPKGRHASSQWSSYTRPLLT
jgi:hypothetical protein